jgi:hypothetical protein
MLNRRKFSSVGLRGDANMTVGLKVDFLWYPIGTSDFVHAFFSTICFNAEDQKWANKFPVVMKNLYSGELSYHDADRAIEEILIIRKELKEISPQKVVWDIEDLSKQPPWGDDISSDITDLSNYFITCDGEDIFDVILCALKESMVEKQNVFLKSL